MAKKHWFAKVLIVASASLLLTACGQSNSSTKATPQGNFSWKQFSGQTITVLAETQPWATAIKPLIPQFETLTGINVRWESYSEQQRRQIALVQLQSHSSDSFDVNMSLKSLNGPMYSKAGWYEDLWPFLNNASLTSPTFNYQDFEKAPWGSQIYGKYLYGIPINVEGPVLYYRTDLFNKYGLTPPQTVDDMVTDAKAIEQDSHGQYYGITSRGLPPAVAYTWGGFLHNEGGHWFVNNKPALDSPAAVKALSLYANMLSESGPPGVVNYSFLQSSALFGQGKVAMELDATNELSDITSQANSTVLHNFSVEEFPPGPGGSHPTVLAWSVAMNPFSQHKDAAWYFIQWATSPAVQLQLAKAGIASPRQSTWNDPAFKATLTGVKAAWAEALTETLAQGNPNVGPPIVSQAEARQDIGLMVDAVILHQKSPQQAAATANQQLSGLVNGTP